MKKHPVICAVGSGLGAIAWIFIVLFCVTALLIFIDTHLHWRIHLLHIPAWLDLPLQLVALFLIGRPAYAFLWRHCRPSPKPHGQ